MPPFTVEQFFGVFDAYNYTVFPAQVLLIALAAAVIWVAAKPAPWSPRAAGAIVALIWAWAGVVYHILFFSTVTPAAYLFGSLFLVESLLLGWAALGGRLDLQIQPDAYGVIGGILVLYALIGYPIAAMMGGHHYPHMPTFGVPCPTTIFTFGALLWVNGPVPRRLLAVPVTWTLIGSSAIWAFGVHEDLGMPIAAVLATGLLLRRNRRWERVAPPHNLAWDFAAAAIPRPPD